MLRPYSKAIAQSFINDHRSLSRASQGLSKYFLENGRSVYIALLYNAKVLSPWLEIDLPF
jgi:hypothetical protein